MARSHRKREGLERTITSDPRPVSKDEFIRETIEACKNGHCCSDTAMLDAAYERYVNHPNAPWNKVRRRLSRSFDGRSREVPTQPTTEK